MATRNTAKQKLLKEYQTIIWAIGYWGERRRLAESDEKRAYCQEGYDRNKAIREGLEYALYIVDRNYRRHCATLTWLCEGARVARGSHCDTSTQVD